MARRLWLAFSAWWQETNTSAGRRRPSSGYGLVLSAVDARCRLLPNTPIERKDMNATPKADVAVLIGRFQPFHNGHAILLRRALETAPKVVVVLGSSFHARSSKNPF